MPSIVMHEFPYFSLSLSGSNVTVSALFLVLKKEHVYFVTANQIFISAYDQQQFNYTLYPFIENEDNPGASLYSFEKVFEATSYGKYLSAENSLVELCSHFFNVKIIWNF